MNEHKRCCGLNGRGSGRIAILYAYSFPDAARCNYMGKYFEKGKWWCGKHAPSKIEEREKKSLNRMFSKIKPKTIKQ